MKVLIWLSVFAPAIGCTGDAESERTPPVEQVEMPNQPALRHDVEVVALEFIEELTISRLGDCPMFIPADAELSEVDRAFAFELFRDYVRAERWTPWFTHVEVIDGSEDFATCHYRGSNGGLLVLSLGYHYDVEEWRVSAYEIPARTFARPDGETFSEYVHRRVREAKGDSEPYLENSVIDRDFFIEY